MMTRDFTLGTYQQLCKILVASGYTCLTMSEYMQQQTHQRLPEHVIVLRHDVDSRASHSLHLARIEAKYNLRATYFHRTIQSVYDPDTIQATASLGHEIGYHYETLAQTNGDMNAAITLFGTELDRLRELVPVPVASMHGSPLKPWDNRSIWEHVSPTDFDLVGEAYRDLDYTTLQYYNDTGRTWHPFRYNLRDKTGHAPKTLLDTTAQLLDMIASNTANHLCISTHPERWNDSIPLWTYQAARDVAINSVKQVLQKIYIP